MSIASHSPSQTIEVTLRQHHGGKVAWVAIDNQRRLNTLNSALLERLIGTLTGLQGDASLRALVLTGAGNKSFIGGADIKEMADFDAATARAFITRIHGVCQALRDLPVPVIARIDGYCLGAGLEIAAACDMRAASTKSVFGMPEVKVGIPSVVEACLLPRLIGWGRTSEFLLTGENIDAATAAAWGFIEKLTPDDKLDAAVESWLASIVAAGPLAVRAQKKLMRRWEELPLAQAVQAGIDAFAQAQESDEPRRMMMHFVNRKR